MAEIRQAHEALVQRILQGPGTASTSERQAAFDHRRCAEPLNSLLDKVAGQACRVTDDDITAARDSGLSEDQIFELVVCAAVGQATRQYDSALAALHAATKKE